MPARSSSKTDNVEHVFNPPRAVDNTVRFIKQRQNEPFQGVQQNFPGLAEAMIPWRAGELIAMVGYTSNGKSSLANYVATQHAYRIQGRNQEFNRLIMYVSWEQTIEEQTVLDLSRITAIPASKMFRGELKPTEFEQMMEGAAKRSALPIWLMGHSVLDDRKRPRLSMAEVTEALVFIEDELKMKIDLIVLDYLQRIRRTVHSGDVREGFMNIVDDAKDMALRCPVILLSQSGRQVTEREWQLPTLSDGQETSNLEQSSDHYLSVWMPKQTGRPAITRKSERWDITEDMLFMGVLKQKNGPAPIIKAFKMGFGGSYLNEYPGTVVLK